MLDQRRIRTAFERAAKGFDAADFLHREIRDRLFDRLRMVDINPEWILDLGAGTCSGVPNLARKFQASSVVALDFAAPMLAAGAHKIAGNPAATALCAQAASLPFRNQSIDLIFSNLMLHHCPDPGAVLSEARRVIRFPGLLTFTMLGQESLAELRSAWAKTDAFTHVSPFMDMHHVGDALIQAGFAEPVVDVEVLTVTYERLTPLLKDLRALGSINATANRNPGLTGRKHWRRFTDACDRKRDEDGRLPVTLEVIYGLAWAGEPARGMRGRNGVIEFPIDALIASK